MTGLRTLAAWCLGAVVVTLVLPSAARAAAKLDIEFAVWGFDDRAVPRSFNLLSVGVRNSGDEPFDGPVRARRLLSTAGAWVDVELVEKIFVEPYSSRVVQFYPYMLDDSEEWEVRWGDGLEEGYATDPPPLSAGSRVFLTDPRRPSGIIPALKTFREDLFPANVIGTDTLRVLVMDFEVRWEAARRSVFRDWLYRGGVLHVLHGPDGRFPALPIPELNGPQRVERFGSGRIYWHERTRSDLPRQYVVEKIFPTSREICPLLNRDQQSLDNDPTADDFYRDLTRFYSAYGSWDTDTLLPARLKELIRPRHNWSLLYGFSAAYALLIFPGGLLLSRTRVDYRIGLLALPVIVVLFSVVFSAIGARGYGEASSTIAAAIARPLPDGRWDVEQWSNIFVTAGDQYEVRHTGRFTTYSTAQAIEQVNGSADNGGTARFTADMPPYTSRSFVHRTQFESMPCRITVRRDQAVTEPADALPLRVDIQGQLPPNLQFGWLLIGRVFYPVQLDRLAAGAPFAMLDKHEVMGHLLDLGYAFQRFERRDIADPEVGLERFCPWLITRDLQLRRPEDSRQIELPPGQARLYLFGQLPAELGARRADSDQTLGEQRGRILYVLPLDLPPGISAEYGHDES